jgi:hypothetical protein
VNNSKETAQTNKKEYRENKERIKRKQKYNRSRTEQRTVKEQ